MPGSLYYATELRTPEWSPAAQAERAAERRLRNPKQTRASSALEALPTSMLKGPHPRRGLGVLAVRTVTTMAVPQGLSDPRFLPFPRRHVRSPTARAPLTFSCHLGNLLPIRADNVKSVAPEARASSAWEKPFVLLSVPDRGVGG